MKYLIALTFTALILNVDAKEKMSNNLLQTMARRRSQPRNRHRLMWLRNTNLWSARSPRFPRGARLRNCTCVTT